jgi:flagellar assembly protein FliH
MDPIIRAVAISPVARQLRRQPERAPAPAAVSSPAPKAAPATAPAPAAAGVSEALHQAALRERDVQIDALRAQAGKAQQALTDAFADAERRGYAAGEEQGERAGRELLQVQADRLKALMFQVGQARAQTIADTEDTLVEIAFAAVCRMLGEQGASRTALARIVADAAAAARERDALVVRLHPDDLALLRDDAAPSPDEVRLAADAGVKLGGCLVDSANGTLDARFETELAQLAETLRAVRAGRHTGEDTL